MIRTEFYDVEVLPNFFSITFIDIVSYLNIMKDSFLISNDEKKKKILVPLTQKYKVKEIKELLDKVKYKQFYITDKDDSQLFDMLEYINNMRQHYKINDNGKKELVITDLYGYNSSKYDNLMIAALLMNAMQYDNVKDLIYTLYDTSKKIIEIQNSNNKFGNNDFYINSLRNYKLPFRSLDIMRIFSLHKVSTIKDKNGEKIRIAKSLKQTSINLKWHELLEFKLPPICEKDIHYYKYTKYDNITIEQLNDLIDEWDRYIIDEYIQDMMYYNKNDCFIGCEIVRLYTNEIKLRYTISNSYKINVLSSSRSDIADVLFNKFYSAFSGLHPKQWQGKKTERKALSFKKVIFDFIKFKTPALQKMLEEMKDIIIYSIGKDAFQRNITINKLTYTIATGGLHTQDTPKALYSKWEDSSPFTGDQETKKYKFVHWDISSFYPSIISVYNIAPKHLNNAVFVKLVTWLKETRIEAKHSKKEIIDGIPKDILAEVLKIVINSIYGKMGYEEGNICDRLAVLKVTINGQLMIMMLCEELELNNIEIISANTDGIVVKLYEDQIDKFSEISNNWKKLTKLDADCEEFKAYINRDINNYIAQEFNGNIVYKGALNPMQYARNLDKGYNSPIVAQAVVNYFLYNIPVTETLYNAKDILDFCKTQNIGKQFHVEETFIENNKIITRESQRNCRFYVSNRGSVIRKVGNHTKVSSELCAGYKCTILNSLDDKDISLRDINYTYYYNEAIKIINPIKLRISPSQKGDSNKKIKSGKVLIKKYSGAFNKLFDDE